MLLILMADRQSPIANHRGLLEKGHWRKAIGERPQHRKWGCNEGDQLQAPEVLMAMLRRFTFERSIHLHRDTVTHFLLLSSGLTNQRLSTKNQSKDDYI
jgi:hypothetical protein